MEFQQLYVRDIQMQAKQFTKRYVTKTISAQVLLESGKRKLEIELERAMDVKKARIFTDEISVTEFPTALAAFHVLG